MAGIPNQLNAFSSTFSFFENAAKNGNVATVFDSLLARVDKVAERLSDRAVESGFTDIDDTPIVATFGGEASAYGDNSLAKGLMLGQAVDVGLVSYAMGTCSFTAAATATGEDTALAVTNSFATITGADIVITFGRHGSTPLTSGADLAYSTSTTSFLAVDLEFWDSARGPIEIEYDWETCRLRMPSELDGEIAVLDALLEAFGEDSFAALDAQVLSIEDALSTVTAVGTLATG
ncbi:MAG TPA: hypothetical protein VMT08_02335 [Bradyrhizobium sp.]|nr:hypothetical protein [Bradyrhizobium sp.]